MAVAVVARVTVLSLLVLGNVAQLLFERYDLSRISRARVNDGFKVFWNVPSFQCHKYGVNFSSASWKWGMIQNPEDTFRGDEIAILYDPGLFPAMLPTTVGRSPELRNGGVPQQGDLSLHLSRFQEDMDRLLPDTRFSESGEKGLRGGLKYELTAVVERPLGETAGRARCARPYASYLLLPQYTLPDN